jgi:uncharacterized protein YjbI with pentapeptide repeats
VDAVVADFYRADMPGAQLHGAKLRKANLREADLRPGARAGGSGGAVARERAADLFEASLDNTKSQ